MQNSLDRALLEVRSAFAGYVEKLEKEVRSPINEVIKVIREKNKKFYLKIEELRPGIENCLLMFNELARQLPEKTKNVLCRLERKGWCLDISDLPYYIPYQIEQVLEIKSDAELDHFFKSYFSHRLESIEKEIVEFFPHRSRAISGAFDDHRSGRYYSSILVFLAQADGICYEITGKNINGKQKQGNGLYIKTKARSFKKNFASSTIDPLTEAILYPLMNDLSISTDEKNLPADFSGLNRHLVLHGKLLNYDTEINSFKAMSYLAYIGSISKILKEY